MTRYLIIRDQTPLADTFMFVLQPFFFSAEIQVKKRLYFPANVP